MFPGATFLPIVISEAGSAGFKAKAFASYTENFFVRDDGSTSLDQETREIVKRKFEHLRLFLHRNGLLETSIIDDDGNLIDRPLRKADLTDQGLQLLRTKMAAWLDSKASDANPPKLAMLEKTLAEIRK